MRFNKKKIISTFQKKKQKYTHRIHKLDPEENIIISQKCHPHKSLNMLVTFCYCHKEK